MHSQSFLRSVAHMLALILTISVLLCYRFHEWSCTPVQVSRCFIQLVKHIKKADSEPHDEQSSFNPGTRLNSAVEIRTMKWPSVEVGLFCPWRLNQEVDYIYIYFLLFCTTGKPAGYGPNSRRLHNRGIVDECCFQSCELKRLEMYCAPVKSGKAPRSVREQRHTDTPKTPKVSSISTAYSQ